MLMRTKENALMKVVPFASSEASMASASPNVGPGHLPSSQICVPVAQKTAQSLGQACEAETTCS